MTQPMYSSMIRKKPPCDDDAAPNVGVRSRRILLVEADRLWSDRLVRGMAGLSVDIYPAYSLADARRAVAQCRFDLVMISLHLPDGSGLEVVRSIGAPDNATPILVIASVADTDSRVRILMRGVDDIIEPDMRPDELCLRVTRWLAHALPPGLEWRRGRIVIQALHPTLTVGDTTLQLTPAEHRLLVALARANGAPVSRPELARTVRLDAQATESCPSLDSHLSRLRAKLADTGVAIDTVKFLGYSLRVAEKAVRKTVRGSSLFAGDSHAPRSDVGCSGLPVRDCLEGILPVATCPGSRGCQALAAPLRRPADSPADR